MSQRSHNVAIRIGGYQIQNWTRYDIELNMLEPADGFELSLGKPSREAWDLCTPDAYVQIMVDDVVVVSGYLDEREWSDSGKEPTRLAVRGRDKAGRLVDESMPLVSFRGLGIQQLAEKVAGIGEEYQWFDEVILSNAENRRLLRGPVAPRIRVSKEPAIVQEERPPKRVNPGESRWQVLQFFLERAELLAWSTADGRALVVGLPNYEQEPAYRFFVAAERSDRAAEGNVKACTIHDSVGDRYSEITCVGTPRTDGGEGRVYRKETARNGSMSHGTGADFTVPKRLLLADDDVDTAKEARARAAREMAKRDAEGHKVSLVVKGHTQTLDGRRTALFAPDTMALFEHEETGVKGSYLITRVQFTDDRDEGEITRLDLVPKGAALAA